MSDLCAHQSVMMKNGFIVHHLVAIRHLECVSDKGWDGDNLLCMVIHFGHDQPIA